MLISDQTIGLRRFQIEDLDKLYPAIVESSLGLRSWMTWYHPSYTLDDCRAFISKAIADWASREEYTFAIVCHSSGEVLGSISLNKLNKQENSANVGYWVRLKRAGDGIATRALRLVAAFAFDELDLRRLDMLVPVGNGASQRVAMKAGAKLNKNAREMVMLNGESHDAMVFSLEAAR